jgi:hypothetical protein
MIQSNGNSSWNVVSMKAILVVIHASIRYMAIIWMMHMRHTGDKLLSYLISLCTGDEGRRTDDIAQCYATS